MEDKEMGQLLAAMGEIKGSLQGLRDIMQNTSASLHQRINDIDKAHETRFKNLEERTTKMETSHQALLIRTAWGGGIAGTVSAILVEIVRMKSGG